MLGETTLASDLCASADSSELVQSKPGRSTALEYNYVAHYDSEELAHLAIMEQAGFAGHKWKEERTTTGKNGATKWYICFEAISCKKKVKLLGY